jgi:chromosome segregation ATPase
LSRYNADDQRVERISNDILRMDRERQQLQQSLRREPNPVRREHIQESINSITQRISSADGELRRANDALEQSHRQHLDNLRQENQANRTLGRHQQDLQAATRIVQQLRSLVQATPSLGR